MAISVLTPAAASNLITLDRVKLRLGVTDSASDALLGDFIGSASSAITTYLGFPLGRQEYLETLAGNGRSRLYLSMYPVEPESLALVHGEDAVTDVTLTAGNGEVFRACGWAFYGAGALQDGASNFTASYRAGFLLPGQVSTWEPDATYARGEWARSSSPSSVRFECTSAGTSAEAEPTWPDAGDSVVDGSASWTARTAWELPDAFADHVFLEVLTRFKRRNVAGGVASMEAEGFSVSYFATQTAEELLPSTKAFLDRWRLGRGGVV